jgi:phospholipase/carboxylesterase
MKYWRIGLFLLMCLCSCDKNIILKYKIIIPTEEGIEKFPVVFFLHGLSGTYNQFIPYVKNEIKGAILVFPQAPFPEGENGNSWSKMSFGNGKYTESLEQAEFSRQKLNELIQHIILNYPVDSRNIFICGISQGAMMTLRVGLNPPYPAKGLICINGRLPLKMLNDSIVKEAKSRLGIYVVNGINDPIFPILSGEKLVHELKLNGLNVESHEFGVGHAFHQEMITRLKPWLASKMKEK